MIPSAEMYSMSALSDVLFYRARTVMRILISALLLALSGNKKESKCTESEELTNSFIPAALQVLTHYMIQIHGAAEDQDAGSNATTEAERETEGTSPSLQPDVPVVIVTYDGKSDASDFRSRKTTKRLEKLALMLNGEAKDQGLAECKGFTSDVLKQLDSSSKLTSSEQLSLILKNVINGEMKNPATKVLIKGMLLELEDRGSDLNKDLVCVEPLKYLSVE